MKTHTETIDVQVPDGYTCLGYRKPKEGELYVGTYGGGPETAGFDFTTDKVLVLEKDHKLPVALFVLRSSRATWNALDLEVPNPDSWKFELVTQEKHHLDRYTYEGQQYDLMIITTPATRCLVLGHWNDGPKS